MNPELVSWKRIKTAGLRTSVGCSWKDAPLPSEKSHEAQCMQ